MTASDDSFIDQLRQGFTNAGADISKGLVLAVSGGADSVALLHGVLQIWPESKSSILVAHVNHGLRGQEGMLDAELVRRQCELLDVRLKTYAIEPLALTSLAGKSLEEAARDERYKFLAGLAEQNEIAAVVTGHHLDDQAETVLFNVVRGTGIRGLRGMPFARKLSDRVSLIRPMLEVPQTDIADFVSKFSIPFRNDASNTDPAFTRNRVRRDLLPYLEREFNKSVNRNLASLAAQAGEAVELLDSLADQILLESMLEQQSMICRLNRRLLAKWPVAMIRHVMSVLWIRQAWPRQRMSSAHFQRLAEAVCSDDSVRVDLPGGVELNASGDSFRLMRNCHVTGD